MFQVNNGRRGLRSVLLLGAASSAAIAFALPAMAQDDSSVETVVVTGSRIPQQGLYSANPVTAIGQQEFKLQGQTSVENVLRDLPSVLVDGDNSSVNNGTGGIATIDLRGLGSNRTLILVDGKRLVPSDTASSVDLNLIPSTIVDHVEVLTGGASAVYGADAVAGVVNVITRKDFEGLEGDANYSVAQDGDGAIRDFGFLMGANSANNKGNVTIYGDYTDRGQVLQANRDISKNGLHSPFIFDCATPADQFQGLCKAGSPAIAEGLDLDRGLMFTPDRTLVPYDGRTFNFAPYNYFQTPSTRWSLGANAHYQVDKALDFYTRLTFANTNTTSQLAPTPIIAGFDVNYGNPLLSAQERGIIFDPTSGLCQTPSGPGGTFAPGDTCQIFLDKRLVANGPRIADNTFSAYQGVLGVKGDLGSGWSYDLSGQYGHVIGTLREAGDGSFTRFQQGLLVNPDGTCEGNIPGCVPIDIFKSDGITPDQVAWFTQQQVAISFTTEEDILGTVTGDLGAWGVQSPWAKNPVQVSFGGEYRQEEAAFQPDDNLATGNLLGFGGSPPTSGSYRVGEGFGEVNIPVLEDMPFAKSLTVNGAYRYSSYDTFGGNTTYKYGAEWQPIDDFRIRAGLNRAVRAPNVGELFAPQAISQNAGADPCAAQGGAGGFHGSAALCEATGVPAGNYLSPLLNCPAGQCTALVGGNPNLAPETGTTRTIGLVLTPTFLDGFNATVDYYNIRVTGFITAFGGSVPNVLSGCYDPSLNPTQDPNNPFCQAIHRDAQGRIFGNSPTAGHVSLQNQNVATLRTRGIDFEANYQSDFDSLGIGSGWGSFAVNFVGNYQLNFQQQFDPSQPIQECAGLYGDICGAPNPKWRSNTRLTWTTPWDVDLSVRWRYIGNTRFDEVVINGLIDPPDAKIPAFHYFDVSANWTVRPGLELRGGVNNVFRRDPPPIDLGIAVSSLDSGNTFPGTYDALGRVFFIGATVKY